MAISRDGESQEFVIYSCRNCTKKLKTFAVSVFEDEAGNTIGLKFGEQPTFGPPTPNRVLSLLGEERQYWLDGRQCENQGFGIGAFSYYRRVIEAKKTALIDEVIKVARVVNAPSDMIGDLERARAETQFSKAIDAIKHGIPESLRLEGHNPLALLHDALSDGLHARTDEECLAISASIRHLLFALVERLAAALTDNKELTDSVAKLLQAKQRRAEGS